MSKLYRFFTRTEAGPFILLLLFVLAINVAYELNPFWTSVVLYGSILLVSSAICVLLLLGGSEEEQEQ